MLLILQAKHYNSHYFNGLLGSGGLIIGCNILHSKFAKFTNLDVWGSKFARLLMICVEKDMVSDQILEERPFLQIITVIHVMVALLLVPFKH